VCGGGGFPGSIMLSIPHHPFILTGSSREREGCEGEGAARANHEFLHQATDTHFFIDSRWSFTQYGNFHRTLLIMSVFLSLVEFRHLKKEKKRKLFFLCNFD